MIVRPATVADYDGYQRLFPELGVDDPLPSRDRFAELVRRMFVAVESEVVGYSLFEVLADVGYVRNIVSDPGRRRGGIGVALMTAMRDHFIASGATTWCLNVKPGNAAAIELYERFGLRRVYRSTILRLPREIALPSPPPDLALVPVPPDTDPIVEPQFRLLRGQLASSRDKGGRVIRQLVRGTEVLAVGVFAFAMHGAFPCRIADPLLASALVARFRELAPGEPWIQIGVEDDEPFRDELVRLGADVHLEIAHMRGPLT